MTVRADLGPPVVAVVGPTASGKSALALDLAERATGEIVNTDAMALYRGMDIGTAKTPLAARRGIPHHLLDVLDVGQEASVAVFRDRARAVVASLRARGSVPVLVGGSALYTRAVLDELDFPGTDPAVRRRLEDELAALAERGPGAMHDRLAAVDPAAAAEILPGNTRRVVRALEVVEITGRPFRARLPEPAYAVAGAVQIGVRIDRPTLDARIERRVADMYADGLVDEVVRLLDLGLAEGRTARTAIGYREVMAHLRGETTLAEAAERTAAATRRFARRQEGWYARDPRITWIEYDDPHRVDRAIEVIRGG